MPVYKRTLARFFARKRRMCARSYARYLSLNSHVEPPGLCSMRRTSNVQRDGCPQRLHPLDSTRLRLTVLNSASCSNGSRSKCSGTWYARQRREPVSTSWHHAICDGRAHARPRQRLHMRARSRFQAPWHRRGRHHRPDRRLAPCPLHRRLLHARRRRLFCSHLRFETSSPPPRDKNPSRPVSTPPSRTHRSSSGQVVCDAAVLANSPDNGALPATWRPLRTKASDNRPGVGGAPSHVAKAGVCDHDVPAAEVSAGVTCDPRRLPSPRSGRSCPPLTDGRPGVSS